MIDEEGILLDSLSLGVDFENIWEFSADQLAKNLNDHQRYYLNQRFYHSKMLEDIELYYKELEFYKSFEDIIVETRMLKSE